MNQEELTPEDRIKVLEEENRFLKSILGCPDRYQSGICFNNCLHEMTEYAHKYNDKIRDLKIEKAEIVRQNMNMEYWLVQYVAAVNYYEDKIRDYRYLQPWDKYPEKPSTGKTKYQYRHEAGEKIEKMGIVARD